MSCISSKNAIFFYCSLNEDEEEKMEFHVVHSDSAMLTSDELANPDDKPEPQQRLAEASSLETVPIQEVDKNQKAHLLLKNQLFTLIDDDSDDDDNEPGFQAAVEETGIDSYRHWVV